jgi:hypothetical protein
MTGQNNLVTINDSRSILQIGSIRRSDYHQHSHRGRDIPPSSVIEKLLLVSPLNNFKRYFSFCALVPNLANTSVHQFPVHHVVLL